MIIVTIDDKTTMAMVSVPAGQTIALIGKDGCGTVYVNKKDKEDKR